MKSQRLLIIAGLFIIISVGAIAMAFLQNKKPVVEQPSPTPATVQVPVPTIVAYPASQKQYAVPNAPADFPTTVPVFTFEYPKETRVFAQTVATSLALLTQPQMITTSRGNLYIWTSDTATLSLGEDPMTISYTVTTKKEKTLTATDQEYIALTQGFIQAHSFLLPPGARLSNPETNYFAPTEANPNKTTRERATQITISYRPLLDGKPLFVGVSSGEVINLSFDADKTLIGLEGFLFPGLTKNSQRASVITSQEAIDALYQGKGVLNWINTEGASGEEAPRYNFSTISVQSVTLGYYYSKGQSILTSIFAVLGTSVDSLGKTLKTTTFVSAAPSSSPQSQ